MSPPVNLPREVLAKLASVRRRRRLLAALQAACWMLGAGATLALALHLAPSEGAAPSWARVLARAWVLGGVLVPALLIVAPVWRRTRSWLAVARAVDDRVPETADRLLTAVDLAIALSGDALSADPETRRLARVQLEDAKDAASRVAPDVLLPVTGLPPSTLVGPGLSVVAICVLLLAPGRLERGLDAVFGPLPPSDAEASKPQPEEVTLTLRNMSLELTPPAYSGREPLTLDGTAGDFQALPGTSVVLIADASGGGSGVGILLGDAEAPIAGGLDGRRIEARFVTDNSTTYRIEIPRGLGRDPLRSRTFSIELLPDRPPELEVLAPGGSITLGPEDSLPLNVRAGDDFGLSRVDRVVMRGSSELIRTPLGEVAGLSEWEDLVRWSPAELRGEGGELSIVIEAWDNDTVNGPKRTSSRPVEIYVPTPRDQHRKVLALKEELQRVGLDLLADLLVVNAQGTAMDGRDAITAAHDRAQALAADFLRVADALLQGIAQDSLDEGRTYAGILQMVSNFDARWTALVEMIETTYRPATTPRIHRVLVLDLVAARDKAITELEQIILDLGSFIDLHRGSELKSELADLGNEFAQMQDLLRRAKDGEPLDADLAAAMKKLQERMAELAKSMAQRSSGPDDGFLNRMPDAMGRDAMAEVNDLIAQGKFDEAMAKLREMDEALAAMEKQLGEETSSMAGSQAADELDKELSAAIEEARRLEEQQRGVLEQMDALAEQFGGDSIDPAQREALREEMERLAAEVGALEAAAEADPFVKGSVRRSAWRAGREIEQMREAFEGGRPDEAAAYARETQRIMEEASGDLSETRSPESQGQASSARDAARRAGQIAEQLGKAEARQRGRQAQAQRAGQQAGRQQGGVADGVQALQGQVGEMGGSAFNPARGRDNLGNAEEMMRRAQGRLGEGDPQRGRSAGQDGLSQLQQFRESMEAAQKALREGGPPRPGGQQPGGGRGGRPRWDSPDGQEGEPGGPIELTDPDEFVGPEAFRALVQEGAQGETPDRYKPLNGTYYEELVR